MPIHDRVRMEAAMKRGVWVALLALGGCGGGDSGPKPPVEVSVYNFLVFPVTVSAGGTTYGAITPNNFTVLTLPAATATLTWAAGKATYSNSTPIPDDLGSISVPLPGTATTVDINHVAGGQTYFSPRLVNGTASSVDVAIVQNGTVQCLGTAGPAISGLPTTTRWGYYRVGTATEFRAYQYNTNCTSTSYVYWQGSQIAAGVDTKSGDIQLVMNTAP